jgi:hypothetical protein
MGAQLRGDVLQFGVGLQGVATAQIVRKLKRPSSYAERLLPPSVPPPLCEILVFLKRRKRGFAMA